MPFQFLFLIFSLGAIASVFSKKKSSQLTARAAGFWIFLWLAAAVVALWPSSATIIANHFGIGRGSDFILYISIALMFLILFRLQIKLEMMNRDITKVVRKNALDKKI